MPKDNTICGKMLRDSFFNVIELSPLKDYCDETRVIIQLLLYHNKSYLLNIPSWDDTRDAVVCLVQTFFQGTVA
jgi:potassium large conductance calcium-activated channel subfamily M alpha protein 1